MLITLKVTSGISTGMVFFAYSISPIHSRYNFSNLMSKENRTSNLVGMVTVMKELEAFATDLS